MDILGRINILGKIEEHIRQHERWIYWEDWKGYIVKMDILGRINIFGKIRRIY